MGDSMRIELYANERPERDGPPVPGDLRPHHSAESEEMGWDRFDLDTEQGQREALDTLYVTDGCHMQEGDVVRFGPADWWVCGEKEWVALEETWPVPFREVVYLDAPPYGDETPALELYEASNGFYVNIYPAGLKGASVCRGAGDGVGQYSIDEEELAVGTFAFYECMAQDFHGEWVTWLEAYFPEYMQGDPAQAPRPAPGSRPMTCKFVAVYWAGDRWELRPLDDMTYVLAHDYSDPATLRAYARRVEGWVLTVVGFEDKPSFHDNDGAVLSHGVANVGENWRVLANNWDEASILLALFETRDPEGAEAGDYVQFEPGDDDPRFPAENWREVVSRGEIRKGYAEWARHEVEMARADLWSLAESKARFEARKESR